MSLLPAPLVQLDHLVGGAGGLQRRGVENGGEGEGGEGTDGHPLSRGGGLAVVVGAGLVVAAHRVRLGGVPLGEVGLGLASRHVCMEQRLEVQVPRRDTCHSRMHKAVPRRERISASTGTSDAQIRDARDARSVAATAAAVGPATAAPSIAVQGVTGKRIVQGGLVAWVHAVPRLLLLKTDDTASRRRCCCRGGGCGDCTVLFGSVPRSGALPVTVDFPVTMNGLVCTATQLFAHRAAIVEDRLSIHFSHLLHAATAVHKRTLCKILGGNVNIRNQLQEARFTLQDVQNSSTD